ncbi:MAG: dihydrodipicolinate synthase family protein [Clostridia bacterium]|nr:dihydrodipicolinate synthase family protein [Clostridia bacterium]
MKDNVVFKGVYSALFSIYDKEMNVIVPSVRKLIDYNLKNGIRGFYVGGNTGECTVLPNKTRMQMLETVKENAGDAVIFAHIGAGHFDDTAELLEHANSVGVDAVASLPPSLTSYYKPEEIIEYYKYLAKHSKSPVMAYVTPVLTCDPIWFAKEIMKIENVIGIKLTIPNYYLFEKMKLVNNGNINLLNGPDECMLAGLIMGADGAIGTTYNLMPKTACNIYDNFIAGNIEAAKSHQHKLNRCIDILAGNSLSVWKSVLAIMDIDAGYTVAPGISPNAKEVNNIIKSLQKCGCTEEMVQ